MFTQETIEEVALADRPERKKKLGILFWICVAWIALNLIAAIFANVLPIQNPLTQNYALVNAGPSLHHLFGTDDLGRDIFSRVVYGSRVSIEAGLGAMVIGFGIGAPLGWRRIDEESSTRF
jgi:peptide/nickel transport system permease protein